MEGRLGPSDQQLPAGKTTLPSAAERVYETGQRVYGAAAERPISAERPTPPSRRSGRDSFAKLLSSFIAPRRLAAEMELNDGEGSIPGLPRTWHAEVR